MKSYKITAIATVLALAVVPVKFQSYADSEKISADDITDIIIDGNVKAETTTTIPHTT